MLQPSCTKTTSWRAWAGDSHEGQGKRSKLHARQRHARDGSSADCATKLTAVWVRCACADENGPEPELVNKALKALLEGRKPQQLQLVIAARVLHKGLDLGEVALHLEVHHPHAGEQRACGLLRAFRRASVSQGAPKAGRSKQVEDDRAVFSPVERKADFLWRKYMKG